MTVSKNREEKIKVGHRRIRSNLDGLFSCHDEGIGWTTSCSSCCILVQFVVPFCCELSEGKELSDVEHGITMDCLCIRCLPILEAFCNMNCAMNRNMARTLHAPDEYTMIMDRVDGMKAANYGQLGREQMLKDGQIVSHVSLSSVLSFLDGVKMQPDCSQTMCILCSRSIHCLTCILGYLNC